MQIAHLSLTANRRSLTCCQGCVASGLVSRLRAIHTFVRLLSCPSPSPSPWAYKRLDMPKSISCCIEYVLELGQPSISPKLLACAFLQLIMHYRDVQLYSYVAHISPQKFRASLEHFSGTVFPLCQIGLSIRKGPKSWILNFPCKSPLLF